MYKLIIRPLMFMFPPEFIHNVVVICIKLICKIPGVPNCLRAMFDCRKTGMEKELFGIMFRHPVGLAAGFDKNASFYNEFSNLGFSFIETGTVTPRPQSGNPRPRSFRLPKDKAIINRMGFNNMGADAAAANLKKYGRRNGIIVGGNIGKNTNTPNEKAPDDYLYCFNALYDCVDYFTVNVSCPNIANLGLLQSNDNLAAILSVLCRERESRKEYRPILLKISPDLTEAQIDSAIEIVNKYNIDGIVAVNTTTSRLGLNTPSDKIINIGNGGLSGQPLYNKSNSIIKYITAKTEGKLPIIGVGGIMSPEQAVEQLKAGAWLIQIYTGFIYEGPCIVRKICSRLKSELPNYV